MIRECWNCGGVFRLSHTHRMTKVVIRECAECHAPSDVFDIEGMRVMDASDYKEGSTYAVEWRRAAGALDSEVAA